jgi:hypothetical protein
MVVSVLPDAALTLTLANTPTTFSKYDPANHQLLQTMRAYYYSSEREGWTRPLTCFNDQLACYIGLKGILKHSDFGSVFAP